MNDNDLASKLLSRRDDIEDLVSENKIVYDVLDGRRAIITRTSRKGSTGAPGVAMSGLPVGPNAPATGFPYGSHTTESRYLPKHAMESDDEYQRRLEITPFFPETPGIEQSRQGAIFRKPPDIHLPDNLLLLLERATMGGMSLIDTIVKISDLVQTGGFAEICVDREPLPENIDPNYVSEALLQQGVGRIVLAPYAQHQIHDWRSDDRGLLWVKVVERHDAAADWDERPRDRWSVRVVDRHKFRVWDVRRKKDGNFDVKAYPAAMHGATDKQGNPIVPFRFFHPFPARDGIGRSNLRASADADVAAVRLLSDLLWMLHMMAPILTLTTSRDPKDIKDIGLGSSYLNVLQGRVGDRDAESLKFCQLDSTPADKLAAMYDRLRKAAREQANKSADVGVAGPVEQSGISKAWTFKTGEERVLFLLSICLQEGFQWILELAARMTRSDDGAVSVRFAQNYDITGVPEQIAIVSEAEPLLAKYHLKTALSHSFKQVTRHLLGNAPDEEILKSDKECDEILNRALPAGAAAGISLAAKVPLTESDGMN